MCAFGSTIAVCWKASSWPSRTSIPGAGSIAGRLCSSPWTGHITTSTSARLRPLARMSASPPSEGWKTQESWTKELLEQGVLNAHYETYRSHEGLHIRLVRNNAGKEEVHEALVNGLLLRSRTCRSGQRSLLKAVRNSLRAQLGQIG